MNLLPLAFEPVLAVARAMRAADREEIFATRWDENVESLAADCVDGCSIGAVLAGRDNAPIAVVAAMEMWPTVWSVWMFATDRWPEVALDATRFVKERMVGALLDLGLRRAECRSAARHRQAHRWLEHLGARREAVHRDYGKNGETFIGFYWRSEDVRQSLQTQDQGSEARQGTAIERREGHRGGAEGAAAAPISDGAGLDPACG